MDLKVHSEKLYNIKVAYLGQNVRTVQDATKIGWKTFPFRNLPPNFNYGHIYHYVVEPVRNGFMEDRDPQIDMDDSVTPKPLGKGRCLLKSGFVENLQHNFDEDKLLYIVRAHVQHVMKNLFPLSVVIFISNAVAYVLSCSYTCKASLMLRCCHVTSVLLMLSD